MKRAELFFTSILVPLDFLAIVAAGFAAYSSRFHPLLTAVLPVNFNLTLNEFTPIALVGASVWILIFAAAGLYRTSRRRIWDELIHVVLACSAGVAAILGILFFSREFFDSRYIVLVGWGFAILFVCAERVLVRALQRSLLANGIGMHRVALIGKNKTADGLARAFATYRAMGFEVVAQFESFNTQTKTKLAALKAKNKLDELILIDPDLDKKTAQQILFFADTEQLTFKYAADLFSPGSTRTQMHMYVGVPVVEVKRTPLDGWGAIYKRWFDIIVSFLLILITLPIQLVIVIALFLEQPGRVLFSRLPDGKKTMRVGEGGRPFHYFKFRSMVRDAHKYRFDPEFIKKYGNMRDGSPLFKLKDDPRVTPVGKVLRKFSLDEIPEFYLVLLGRMSLVGPRPHLPEEVAKYQPWQKNVLMLKPGITGMAQVSGRADLNFDEEVQLDIYYIENWSPLLDLYILFKTPLIVFLRKGAY